MAGVAYRSHFFFMVLGNLIYVTMSWFLWKAVYAGQEVINGMTFNQTYLYLTLAAAIFSFLQNWTEWFISRRIIDGSIVMDFIKPLKFQFLVMANVMGGSITNLVAITIPTFLIVTLVFKAQLVIGITMVLFAVSLIFSFLISYFIDFCIGLVAFKTESVWGISATKETIILVLSGAVIPIAFFPEPFRQVLAFLPFQAIYHTPLTILLDPKLDMTAILSLLGIQLFWTVAMYLVLKFFLGRAVRILSVNGG
jgi:ABC-2 type transport system permease protein